MLTFFTIANLSETAYEFSLLILVMLSEEIHTEEGIPSPLAPSLLVTFYSTQRIRWRYSLFMPATTGHRLMVECKQMCVIE